MDVAKALRELSAPHHRDEKMVAIIERSARIAGLTYSRAYEIIYGRARRISPEEIARIREELKKKQAMDVRNELAELRIRLSRLENLLLLSDEKFNREDIAPLRGSLRRSR